MQKKWPSTAVYKMTPEIFPAQWNLGVLYLIPLRCIRSILACAIVSRKENAIAQTRELVATKAVLLEQGGILYFIHANTYSVYTQI